MENNKNIFQNDDIMKGRGGNKPPSRLRKRAPPTLQLDPTSGVINSGASNTSPGNDSPFSSCPIPLLSPLVLTPPQLLFPKNDDPQVVGVLEGGLCHDDKPRKGSDDQTGCSGAASSSSSSNTGWEHPAAPASKFIDPSSLISFFQSQCGLVPSHSVN